MLHLLQGKTETVSLLGRRLGREVIVTCCGEEFDAKSISRGLLGCARVGSWAAFDEINRLSPNVLSSISEDILSWQSARRQGGAATLSGQPVELTAGAAVFIVSFIAVDSERSQDHILTKFAPLRP